MAAKPDDITKPTIHVRWDQRQPMECPLCGGRIVHEYNDGGRRIETLKGSLWVLTNYYRCINVSCDLHRAFPIVHDLALKRKKHGVDVWGDVIYFHFKLHMNYDQITGILEYKDRVKISQGTVRAICEYFEVAGSEKVDEETRRLVQVAGKVILSLDGAQPEKGRPALWAFTDRITGRVLATRFLDKASADVLVDIFNEIEKDYEIPIVAVISDKQRNIVKAVKSFKPKIPHVYCQYHFLHHVREPIAAKDSNLLTSIRSVVKELSIVNNKKFVPSNSINVNSSIGEIFEPLARELSCAIATRGDRFKIFPGLEAHENIKYLSCKIKEIDRNGLPGKVVSSLDKLDARLDRLVDDHSTIASEVAALAMDFSVLRARLGKRSYPGKRVKAAVDKWTKMLKSRLKRRDLEFQPDSLKWVRPNYKLTPGECWQQWVRLVASYSDGLYHAYDDASLEHTNNAKESLFSKVKHHFKSAFGRDDIQEPFEVHADHYVRVMNLDFKPETIREVLLATSTALIDSKRHDLHARFATTRPLWRIREIDTGNLDRFRDHLDTVRTP